MILSDLKRGDPIEYTGSYVNARGTGIFLAWEHEHRLGGLWAVIKTNDSIHCVAADGGNLHALPQEIA